MGVSLNHASRRSRSCRLHHSAQSCYQFNCGQWLVENGSSVRYCLTRCGIARNHDNAHAPIAQAINQIITHFALEIDVPTARSKICSAMSRLAAARVAAGLATTIPISSRADLMALATCQLSSTTRTRTPFKVDPPSLLALVRLSSDVLKGSNPALCVASAMG